VPAAPRSCSQAPKLTVMIGARSWSTTYWAERSTPSVEPVVLDTTSLMSAPGATAPDHSTSRFASPSSPDPALPGSGPLTTTVGGCAGSPYSHRNTLGFQSEMWVRPTTAMATPEPSRCRSSSGRVS
jgi:hypothetical protein